MALELPYGVKVLNPVPLEYYYDNTGTPYTSVPAANSAIPSGIRYKGLTVNILEEEYWYKVGILDINLVPKIDILTATRYTHVQGTASATWTINHNLGAEPNITVYDDSTPPNKLLAPVKNNSTNQAIIEMPISVSGKAICLI